MAYVADANLTTAIINAAITDAGAVDVTNVISNDGVNTWQQLYSTIYVINRISGQFGFGNPDVGITSCGDGYRALILDKVILANA